MLFYYPKSWNHNIRSLLWHIPLMFLRHLPILHISFLLNNVFDVNHHKPPNVLTPLHNLVSYIVPMLFDNLTNYLLPIHRRTLLLVLAVPSDDGVYLNIVLMLMFVPMFA